MTTYYSDIHTITKKTPVYGTADKAEHSELDTDGDRGEWVMGKNTTIKQQEAISWDGRTYQNNATRARISPCGDGEENKKIREFYDQYSYVRN